MRILKMKMKEEKQCNECNKWTKSLHTYKDRWFCIKCYNKHRTFLDPFLNFGPEPNRLQSLEEAIKKVRKVNTRINNKGIVICMISVPSCFEGKKVKLVLVEDKDEN